MKLDLGAGEISPPDFVPLGRRHGSEIYPLPYADDSIDEIRASHVLEHFPHGKIHAVMADWVRALKPGGTIKIAVPDFAKIAAAYRDKPIVEAIQGYAMGGQTDANDFHLSVFDEASLVRALTSAGLCMIKRWASEIDDCAALPVSLNLLARKPVKTEISIRAVMSAPRLGFLDTMFCVIEALAPMGIPVAKVSGAFWGQCLTQGIQQALADGADYVLTLDYDSIFAVQHVAQLSELAMVYPEWDAIAPLQASRHLAAPLLTLAEAKTDGVATVAREYFAADLVKVPTAHFGCTLLKAEALRRFAQPWFLAEPASDGGWGPGKTDEDIAFWRQWELQGFSLAVAPSVHIGHAELMVRWLDDAMQPIWQRCQDWNDTKAPPGAAWKGA